MRIEHSRPRRLTFGFGFYKRFRLIKENFGRCYLLKLEKVPDAESLSLARGGKGISFIRPHFFYKLARHISVGSTFPNSTTFVILSCWCMKSNGFRIRLTASSGSGA